MSSSKAPPKVFISYSHDSPEHAERVLELAGRLRADGVNTVLDQYEGVPAEGWSAWMEKETREADFILVICSANYLRKVERRQEIGTGHGVIWESVLTFQDIYDAGTTNTKYISVLLPGAEPDDIPRPLRACGSQPCTNDQEYLELYRRLTSQPLITKPGLGEFKSLPPRQPQSRPGQAMKP